MTQARIQALALGVVALAQGVPFFHAGSEILRSKSGDGDSYDSGDHFNKLDFSLSRNNWGVGLPPASKNRADWDFWRARLLDPGRSVGADDIRWTRDRFLEFLKIRKDCPLFRLRTRTEIQQRLRFLNAERGVEQLPGLIALWLEDDPAHPIDADRRAMLVLIHTAPRPCEFSHPVLIGRTLQIHPAQSSHTLQAARILVDQYTRGAIHVPPRDIVVLEEHRE